MSDDRSIHEQITTAIEEERTLRSDLAAGRISHEQEHARIAELERQLDQLWDLLRRRDAERSIGHDPSDVRPRPEDQVEGYIG